ncbi:hypothetical protein J6590_047259 [Homalodisca vitripennis]|nr:hypothetical protein J6590_047259 [Homalodisca vitripennis]
MTPPLATMAVRVNLATPATGTDRQTILSDVDEWDISIALHTDMALAQLPCDSPCMLPLEPISASIYAESRP